VDKEGNTARERVVALRDLKKSGDNISDATIRERIKALRDAKMCEIRDKVEEADEFAAACCAGLSDKEFAPLPEAVRLRAPELARQFAEHYESYQKEVVRPFAADLLSCHSLIFLVDLADVLGSGVQKLNDTQNMIRTLLECIERGSGFFSSLLRGAVNVGRSIFGGKWGFIDRIAFVASKGDKIRKPDRGKMKPLIEDLARIVARNNGPEDIGYFWCSAVTSTKPLPGDERGLVGRPMWMPEGYRPPEEKPHEVIVPALPERWPLGVWKAEDYVFTDFYPAIPPARYQPPLQLGLDEVLKFVIGV
jgi:predicted YcjX-like family ATPase